MSKKKTSPAQEPEELQESTAPAEGTEDAFDEDNPPPVKRDKNTVISDLVEMGRQKGKLTDQEIMDAMEHFDFDPEQMDKLYEQLEANNIPVVDDFANVSLDDPFFAVSFHALADDVP